jgi:hypothetical protein
MTKLLMVWMVAAGVAAAATCAAWITHVVDQIKLADDSWATGRDLVCGPSIPYGVLPAVACFARGGVFCPRWQKATRR